MTSTHRRRRSRTPSSSTTAAARRASPTASSSRRRTTRPAMVASSTTRRTAARPAPTSRRRSSRPRTPCSRRSTPAGGLLAPNAYLATAIDYLFSQRPKWGTRAAVGKTVVSTSLIDRVAQRLGRRLYEVPVGFKWFADGLFDGSLGFGGEESAGASFLRRDGGVWTTDKDGIVPALLAGEITARTGRDPGRAYDELATTLGRPFSDRVEAVG